ncbi:MAG TPA: hypothetical protein DDX71_05800 [Ruminococcus sp.]|nr:hypothetical protein [Ruminococcus sp.]
MRLNMLCKLRIHDVPPVFSGRHISETGSICMILHPARQLRVMSGFAASGPPERRCNQQIMADEQRNPVPLQIRHLEN